MRSYRVVINARSAPKACSRVAATFNPINVAARIVMCSTISMRLKSPETGFRICVVGVDPCGVAHCSCSVRSSAIFGCAPAKLKRPAASTGLRPSRYSSRTADRSSATSLSVKTEYPPRSASPPVGRTPSGRICSAPATSAPMWERIANALLDFTSNLLAIAVLAVSLSVIRPSRKGRIDRFLCVFTARGIDSDSGVGSSRRRYSPSYANRISPLTVCSMNPQKIPSINTDNLLFTGFPSSC